VIVSFKKTSIFELIIITPYQFEDEKGFFKKYFNKNDYMEQGLKIDFTEFNVIMS
jgi:dTDP-4-dehydrorhamnose 3,5-epimerase-like enzyme